MTLKNCALTDRQADGRQADVQTYMQTDRQILHRSFSLFNSEHKEPGESELLIRAMYFIRDMFTVSDF